MSDHTKSKPVSAKEIVEKALAAGARGDGESAMSMFSTEVVANYGESLSYGGEHRGLHSYRHALGELNSLFALEVQSVTVAEVEGDRVLLLFDTRYTASATNLQGRQMSMELLTFVDGRVSEVQITYSDTAALLALLSVGPVLN